MFEEGAVDDGLRDLPFFGFESGQSVELVPELVVGSGLVGVEEVDVGVDADAYLMLFPPGSDPKKDDRKTGDALERLLDAYNNPRCDETPVIPE